jgi:ferric-dicitrate binding protein FerR (iron transport regulator)
LHPSVARRTFQVPGAFGGFVISKRINERAGSEIPARYAITPLPERSSRLADGAKSRLNLQSQARIAFEQQAS